MSRKTGYKWLERYEEQGPAGLVDRSRRPHHSPNATARRVVEALEELRRRHPTWGAGKLLKILRERHPRWQLPARSTGCELLKRAGLVRQRRRQSRAGSSWPAAERDERAERGVVGGLQGSFQDARRCVLLPADGDGRVQPLPSRVPGAAFDVRGAGQACIRAAVRGVRAAVDHPDGQRGAVCVDGPGSAVGVVGVVDSAGDRARADRAGVTGPERASRADAQDAEGRDDAATGANLSAQQVRFNRFRREYNEERPHEALGQETPASVYEPSARQFPRKLPELEYPGHYETRYVSENGGIRWKKCWVNVTTTLAHEWVGLEEVGDGLWDVYFSRLRLGRLDERRMQIEDPYGRWSRWEAVTHVPGQICHPCPRLSIGMRSQPTD